MWHMNNLKFVISNNSAILIYLLQFIYQDCILLYVCETQMGGQRWGQTSNGGHAPWTTLGAATDFGSSGLFKVIVVDTNKKLVTVACYDKQHVSAYPQPFLRYISEQR